MCCQWIAAFKKGKWFPSRVARVYMHMNIFYWWIRYTAAPPLIDSCSGPEWCHNGGTPTLGKTSQFTAERSKHKSPLTSSVFNITGLFTEEGVGLSCPPGSPNMFKVKPSRFLFSQLQDLWSLVVFDCAVFNHGQVFICMRTLHSYEQLGSQVKAVMKLVRHFQKELHVLQRTLRWKGRLRHPWNEPYSLSCTELDDKIDTPFMCRKNVRCLANK